MAAVNALRTAVMRLSRRLKHQRVDESLSPTEMSVLGTLARCGSATPGELARKEHVQPPSMTRIVAMLEAKGLVRLEPHPDGPTSEDGHPDRAGRVDARRQPQKRNAWLADLAARPRRGRMGEAARGRARAGEARALVVRLLPPGRRRRATRRRRKTRRRTRLSTGTGADSAPAPDDKPTTDHRRPEGASAAKPAMFSSLQHPQLPALRDRSGRLQHRHLDAAHRPGLAGAQPHRLRHRRRHHHRAAVPAHAALRALRRRHRRPLRQAQAAAGHPVRHGRSPVSRWPRSP